MVRRQQTGCLRHKILLVVVVMLEGEVLVFGVICLVVLVVGVVQFHKIHDADVLLVRGGVVKEMMKKCANLEKRLHTLPLRRTRRQNLEGKEDEHVFFHRAAKGSRLVFVLSKCLFYLTTHNCFVPYICILWNLSSMARRHCPL
jgi:hypothetical protein